MGLISELEKKKKTLAEYKSRQITHLLFYWELFYWELAVQTLKSLPAVYETWIPSLVRKIPGRRCVKPL